MREEVDILILDFSTIFYEAMDEIVYQLKTPDIPQPKLTDMLGKVPYEVFLYWIAYELEQNFCIASASLYRTGFGTEDLIIDSLSPDLKESVSKLITENSISSVFFPDLVELKFLGAGIVAAIRSE